MINSVQSMQDFAAAVKSTFKWYIRNADSLWQEYSQNTGAGDPYFDPSTYTQEERSAIEDSLEKGRAMLIMQGVQDFPLAQYRAFARTFLFLLDREMESWHDWWLYPDYQPTPNAQPVDMYATVGAHSFIYTIIIDVLPTGDKEATKAALLTKYQAALEANADAIRQVEDMEMLWDTICFVNVLDPAAPQIAYDGDLD